MQVEDEEESSAIEADIREATNLSAEQIGTLDKITLATIGKYLLDGLTEEEACILAGLSHEKIAYLQRTNNGYNKYVEKKRIEFKHRHLRNVNTKTDAKASQWMLEKTLPNDFSGKTTKREDEGATSSSVFAAIINEVQSRDTSVIQKDYDIKSRTSNRSAQGTKGTEGSSGDSVEALLR